MGKADFAFPFGNPGDTPIAGDFDGDGKDDIGLYRAGTGYIYLKHGLGSGVADEAFYFGNPSDVILTGDWNGNGIDTVAAFRPSNGNWYIKLINGTGGADHAIHLHSWGTTKPVAGNFATSSGAG